MTSLLLGLLCAAPYDPLLVQAAKVDVQDFVVDDAARRRAIPLRAFLPSTKRPAPLVLFSHGLGGAKTGNAFLGEHWAKRGFLAVFIQHPGSDEHVWQDVAKEERLGAMKNAASVENFLARTEDIRRVLDALTAWTGTNGHLLQGRADLSKIAMTGHSFGAVTTQAVAGQRFPLGADFTDARIGAAVAFSPSSPRRGSPKDAFSKVSIPWLLMTGTNDASPIGQQTAESRRAVFPALPAGAKYELVLDGAEHSAFTDRALPGDSLPRNPNHHRVMLAFTTAFFDAFLRGDAQARAWLEGEGAKALLEPKDSWQRK